MAYYAKTTAPSRRGRTPGSDLPRTAEIASGLRFYSSGLGRWISRDPIEEAGGVNLHLHCFNDSANRVDAFGQSPVGIVVIALALWAGFETAVETVCSEFARKHTPNGTDAYLHCMTSCQFSKCESHLFGPFGGAARSFIGGVLHEIIQHTNTIEGALADIRSNLRGIVGSLNPFQEREESCKCEKGKQNPM
jgi:RHS repeat-associated protein